MDSKKNFRVECTCVYNSSVVVEASDYDDALAQVKDMIDNGKPDNIPNSISIGEVGFDFGEITVDYAEQE